MRGGWRCRRGRQLIVGSSLCARRAFRARSLGSKLTHVLVHKVRKGPGVAADEARCGSHRPAACKRLCVPCTGILTDWRRGFSSSAARVGQRRRRRCSAAGRTAPALGAALSAAARLLVLAPGTAPLAQRSSMGWHIQPDAAWAMHFGRERRCPTLGRPGCRFTGGDGWHRKSTGTHPHHPPADRRATHLAFRASVCQFVSAPGSRGAGTRSRGAPARVLRCRGGGRSSQAQGR